ncbi:MAG: phenylacetate--CoA ligase [Candidatus Methanomethylicota archaeon]|jgi:phenylacetate-CoA ligase|uniref:Phenylacetate--CoA ligase n=1 Tax=Thermoproteota archaeon TaxID=2056631 RepID=A0A523BBS4_9CREN|nr:MAG: phenylacetate--CoA ligase family protein [Candidatus Verstraetearchaeota archaeon]TDA38312.1 MAG: phenylacetate--CoA ligase [Candidatus Verstraetearchaeota archaeon]
MYKLSKKEIIEIQNKRLRAIIKYAYENSPFYRRKFSKIDIDSIRTKEDLKKIPFTTKDDVRENYPLGLLAVDFSKIIRFHASSGTTGNPTVVAYTKKDLENWTELCARCLELVGVTSNDVVQIAYGYGLFTGGLGFHYGAEKIGAKVIPTSTGNTKRQIKLMKDLGTTVICCTPSYGLYLAETAKEENIDPKKDLKLRIGVFGAEPWSENTRKKLEENFVENAYDIYGMAELTGPGVAIECKYKNGLHVWEDYFIVEIIDPNTGEVLEPGEKGEMVITTLMKEAMPFIRYRTRDITILEDDQCDCGLDHARIMRILGRTDDMLKIRGICVFPSQIEEVILKTNGLSPHYQIIADREGVMDKLIVRVEVAENFKTDKLTDVVMLQRKLEEELKDSLGIDTIVELVEPKKIPRSEGKAQRIIDLRKMKGLL